MRNSKKNRKKIGLLALALALGTAVGVGAWDAPTRVQRVPAAASEEYDFSDLPATESEFYDAFRDEFVDLRDEPEAAARAKPPSGIFEYKSETKGLFLQGCEGCAEFIDEDGNLGTHGKTIREYIKARDKSGAQYLSNSLVGMSSRPQICPNWKKLDGDQKIRFWVWFFAALAFEESSCKAGACNANGTNDTAIGFYQLEQKKKLRSWRGPNCNVALKTIKSAKGNIRCAMDIIQHQITPGSWKGLKSSGLLYGESGQTVNSYFQWLRKPGGGDVGKHVAQFKPCHLPPKSKASRPETPAPRRRSP